MYSENKKLMYKYTGCDQVLYQAFRCFTARKLKRSWDREQLNGQISNYVQVVVGIYKLHVTLHCTR